MISTEQLQWQLLLEPSIPTLASNSTYARAFQLLLERKRLSTWGITSYELHKKSGRIIFPAASSLFQCLDTGYNVSMARCKPFSMFFFLFFPRPHESIFNDFLCLFQSVDKSTLSIRIGTVTRSNRSSSVSR